MPAAAAKQRQTGNLVVRGGAVLTADGRLNQVDLLIADGRIAEIGDGLKAPSEVEVLDARGMIVFPGLINAHYHSGENFNPGLYENLPLDLWFVHSHQVTREGPPSSDAIYARTMLGAVLMLRSGATACVDFLYEAPEITLETLEPVVRAYRDVGMRATILLGVADKPFANSLPLDDAERAVAREAPPPTREGIMSLARAAVDRWHEPGGLIGIGLGPSAPQRCTPELLDETLALARERDLVWQTHVLETKSQAYASRQWYGHSFVEWMAGRGLLAQAATLVHTVWLSDRDIELMRAAGSTAVHCLLSNLRLGDGIARLPALRRAGVRVALGTDGRGCDETLDMLELTKMTASVHKVRGGDWRDWPTAREALEMSTSAASVCTGHGESLGRIERGARADLVMLPRDGLAFTPLHDPVRQLVYGAPSRDVRTVVVDGRVVVRDGEVLGIDLEDMLASARKHTAEVLGGKRRADADEIEELVDAMYQRVERAELEVDAYLPM
jgi:cytosine/adenosine deaminase-related metal-dependent hydrolase